MPKQGKRDGVYWRKDCGKYWISYIGSNCERKRDPGSINWDEARAMLAKARVRVDEEENPKPGELPPCELTFQQVADEFLAHQKARITAKGYQREEGIVSSLKAFFTGKLAEVTPAQVSNYVTIRLGKVSKSSVRNELVTLKHLYRLACGEWRYLPRFSNPTLDVESPKFKDERTQHLSPDQFRRLLAASPDNVRPIFALLTATGMRRSELLGCKWKYIDQKRILLPTSKNDEPKEVHLNLFA